MLSENLRTFFVLPLLRETACMLMNFQLFLSFCKLPSKGIHCHVDRFFK